METTVKLRHIKQSARKVRFIVNEVRGIKVTTALEKLFISNKKASLSIKKAIESGIANLVSLDNDFNKDDLYISSVFVDEGPSMKRFRPRAMGRASSIIKRSCHLTLTLTNKSK
ncbi:MAG: 50S ribosomal protein L22 [Candidatus Marinimicrobia bacterium]|nr:50S ribosomal protein L22 [Candidatus Neomarinimicrobiota bacterium]|tara:strand:- start:2474 stop:2815 length:342 start_codon:yes stop_codon:yes gene_type:complete